MITDARTTAKVTAAARAKAKSSKDIEKWEDNERMTVNSIDHQLRVGEVAKVRSEDETEVVVKNVRPAHIAIFCDKQEDITPEII